MSTVQAQAELARIKNLFALLEDTEAIYPEWERLVIQHEVKGKNVHDARIAAAMNVHGVTQLLTFNAGDFKRFTGFTIIAPSEVLQEKA